MSAPNETLEQKLKILDEKISQPQETIEEVDPTHYIFEKAKLLKENKMREEALSQFKNVIEKTQSFNLKMDSYFEILHIGIMYKDLTLLSEYRDKCSKALQDGGDWEKRNRLKVYEGLYHLLVRNFKDAGRLFLEALMTFTNYELFDYKTFVFYTCITNIITVDRVKLKSRIIDNSDVLSCIREIPNLQKFLESFYNGQYLTFFQEFSEIIKRTSEDFFLSKHNNYFIKEMRIKVYTQFLQSFKSVTIDNMALCFGVSPVFIDNELSNFIAQGRISAKIDKVMGVIECVQDEPTVDLYHRTIKESDILLNKKPKDNLKKERPREVSSNTGNRRISGSQRDSFALTTSQDGIPMISNMNQSLNNNLNTSVASSLNSNSTSKTFNQNATHNSGNINVISRFRPLNEKEKSQSKDLCVDFFGPQDLSIKSTAENNNTYKFTFDRIFDYNSTQQEVYEVAAKPIVDSVLEGFNGTIFAYGQTSSGKTHTMQGILENPEKEGIIPRMIRYVFNYILHSKEEVEFTVKVSMIEIYMEKIRDLIDTKRSNLNIREDRVKGVYIEDLSEHYVGNEMEVLELMKIGSENRAIAATNMNDHSSRSHSIFIMTIHQNNLKDSVAKTGKLYLVDLAGSEKISKTGATGHTLEEAKMINRSLTCLGMVINNLTDGKSTYIPYRDSKLTRVLSESLGGNAKTTLVITCSPSTYNESETLSTLRFGLRAKKIKNKPKINKEVTVAELKLEIDRLERFLVVCNKRIVQLENFIVKNGLVPPKEGEVDSIENNFHPNPQKIENLDGNKSKLAKLNEIVSEIQSIKLSDDKNEFLEDEINKNDLVDQELESQFNETAQPQQDVEPVEPVEPVESEADSNLVEIISTRYEDLMTQLGTLQDDKSQLNDKLETAIGKVNEYSVTIEQKQILINQLEDINKTFESKVQELYEKIQDLQEKLQLIHDKKEHEDELTKIQHIISLNESQVSLSPDFFNLSQGLKWDVYSKIHEIVKPEDILVVDKTHEIEYVKFIPLTQESTQNNSTFLNEEVFRKEKRKYDNEKKLILKALEEKSEKINQVENENKELKEKIKLIESRMNPDDKNHLKKIYTLEKNLEKVNSLYHDVVTAKSVLKIENQVLEKKIKKRNEKITIYEKENLDLKEQVRMRDEKLSYYGKSVLKNNMVPHNLVKVIKGGQVRQSLVLNDIVPPSDSPVTEGGNK